MNIINCCNPLSILLVVSILFSNTAYGIELNHLWSIKDTFNMPESATFDKTRQVIYVSNVNQYAKDGNGFISKISKDGKSIDLKWMTGLNSPTGLAVYKNTLYAADFDALVAIDLLQNKIITRYEAPDAEQKPSLNDVAISSQGEVFISGSGSRKIYHLVNGKLVVWMHDKEKLKLANGLFIKQDTLIHGGLYWSEFDLQSKKQKYNFPKPTQKLKDFDGITSDGDGGFIVTVIDDSRIWHISKQGDSKPLSEEKLQGIDLQYLPTLNLLLIPQVGGGLSAFKITQ